MIIPHISGPTDTSNFDCIHLFSFSVIAIYLWRNKDFEEEFTDHKEDGYKQEDYAISNDKQADYDFEYDDRLADAGLCADYSLADLCADYSLSDLAGYKTKRSARTSAGTQSCGGTPKTISFREKLEKRYSVHDMHFAGYPYTPIISP